MKSTLTLALILVSQIAFAAGEHEASQIPARTIFWQTFNLTILFGALFYYLRQPVIDYFRQRRGDFVAAANKSQAAKMEAEKGLLDIQHKIEHLEAQRAENMARAEAEAVEMRKQMIRDAQELAARIRQEAGETLKSEVARARQDLQEQFVRDAVSAARTVLSKDISPADHSRLQTDFNKNLGANA